MVRLIAENLTCRRSERTLFEGLSFTVNSGGALLLTGPNGVGKTSLLRILAGLLNATGGGVRPEPDDDIPLPEHSCLIGVSNALKLALNLREHVDFWLAAESTGARHSADDVLDAWNLIRIADTPCGWLSTGQRRRAALARLSCSARAIWLLDEPLSGLDEPAARLLDAAVARHRADGGLIVCASHQPLAWPDVERLALGPKVRPSAPDGPP
ncbi:heme ABC exporter ATP-binding protein CcmA [Terrarubrum flagellatum]|uniref:heme ABC exporter ATP-binding protein CcmA n=1 Tax=Terrirubrum flagellatum TaxID=2895980 RepID=UPI0031453CE4